jgi:transcriptional regulator with XRE-family HTH domain
MAMDAKRIGERIGQLRTAGRWSLRALAAEAGLSHEHLRDIEAGRVPKVSGELLDRIAHALGWGDYHAMMATEGLTAPAAVGAGPRSNADVIELEGRERRPLIEFGACGVPSPTDGLLLRQWEGEDFPIPESKEGRDLIGPRGFAVRIRGQSMTRWRLREGDVVWINPDKGRAAGYNRPVLARLLDAEGHDLGMVVKVLALDDQGKEYLHSAGEEGDNDVRFRFFEFFGVCVRRSPRDEPLILDVTAEAPIPTRATGPYFIGDEQKRAG